VDRAEYKKLREAEERMWWFRALHANLLAALRRALPATAGGPVLDAGCGTGGFLAKLLAATGRANGHQTAIYGIDADEGACAAARAKTGAPCVVVAGSVNALPFADGSLAAIVSADVLCHRNVDEAAALWQFHRCLRPGGVLVLNLPAYPWLLSAHDAAVHNIRRYTRTDIAARLAGIGFAAVRTTHWNAIPFPLMALRRLLMRGDVPAAAAPESDVRLYPAPVEAAFRGAMAVERSVLRLGFSIPFGGSIIATAVKDG
jgi:SAM-dependent methyltransferase